MPIAINSPTITWGDFNSLIQLSIGLNAAFATFSDFLGDGLSKEEQRIERVIKTLDKRPPDGASPNDQDTSTDRLELQFLLGQCTANKTDHERFRYGFVRVGGFICACLGAGALIYASYNANTSISGLERIGVLLLLLPFALGSWHGMYTSIRSHLGISVRRRVIEKRIAERRKTAAVQRQKLKLAATAPAPETV